MTYWDLELEKLDDSGMFDIFKTQMKEANFHFSNFSIDRDAQLLANRIALLKQEEMKTWKKIEETKKRTNDISGLKKRNEEKVQKKIFDI